MAEKEYQYIIIGAGIVGSALATFLSQRQQSSNILVLDRAITKITGSTGYAPGFLGQFNQSKALTELAIQSLKEYDGKPGFSRAGGFEFAETEAGIAQLRSRCEMASEAGLDPVLLSRKDALERCSSMAKAESFEQALYFPTDGVADPKILCSYYRQVAVENGVDFVEGEVKSLEVEDGKSLGVTVVDGRRFSANHVILASGIWTAKLAEKYTQCPVPIIPVGHPYVYSTQKIPSSQPTPFLRWPEDHVYARDHMERYGIGSYDHAPLHITQLRATAREEWTEDFTPAIQKAIRSKLNTNLGFETFPNIGNGTTDQVEKINGVFAVTPDNLPLLGPVDGVEGLWMAAAIWVTHAAGAARLLDHIIHGEDHDSAIAQALHPARFQGRDILALEQEALRQYNDIYRSKLDQ